MTIQIKNYPFEVRLSSQPVSVVLADQVKNLDWRNRRAAYKGKASASELADVKAKLTVLLG
jgi:mRNA interferase MazF